VLTIGGLAEIDGAEAIVGFMLASALGLLGGGVAETEATGSTEVCDPGVSMSGRAQDANSRRDEVVARRKQVIGMQKCGIPCGRRPAKVLHTQRRSNPQVRYVAGVAPANRPAEMLPWPRTLSNGIRRGARDPLPRSWPQRDFRCLALGRPGTDTRFQT
jgi:hypothetical protein